MRPEDRLLGAGWLLAAGLGAAQGAGLLSLDALSRVRACLFRFLSGIPCPGCGMGRSVLEFFGGDWIASFAQHPLGPALALAWTLWLGRGLARTLNARGSF
jgi:hypothetical protein